jgi:hypothetical protein
VAVPSCHLILLPDGYRTLNDATRVWADGRVENGFYVRSLRAPPAV